mmetsp:Transcript_22339/g.27318  ORF Transcript_22339/g.27318 Transcript_22339/m.27318 type:complete len:91 (+) Transcript_22339:154-426(+)
MAETFRLFHLVLRNKSCFKVCFDDILEELEDQGLRADTISKFQLLKKSWRLLAEMVAITEPLVELCSSFFRTGQDGFNTNVFLFHKKILL